ncbi:hypothetical protein ACLOJK_009446 [Asimina triloba]
MGRFSIFFFCCHLLFIVSIANAELVASTHAAISRNDFPPGFVFGAGTSAYQAEGAAAEDGRKPSIWDTFTHAGRTEDKSTGDVSADQYHKYKEDVKLMHEMGLEAYRFSISWSRLIPDGRGAVNPKGIEAHGTINHFDLPQSLEDEYGGYLSPKFIDDFIAYADVCFREFGDRVKKWITFNEPNMIGVAGYDAGIFPPGRCSYPFGRTKSSNCSQGSSPTEAYIFSHNILLSHAAAVNLYREKYQEKQRGSIGLTIFALWFEPATNSLDDVAATKRVLDFHLGWILHPLVFGNYPASMRRIVGSRLPSFTEDQIKKVKGSFDFVGLNHYTTFYIQNNPHKMDGKARDYLQDIAASVPITLKPNRDSQTLREGYGTVDRPLAKPFTSEYMDKIDDLERVDYLQGYIEVMLQSIRNGSNVRGYFVWSFIDCFELLFGYTSRYGLYQVDFQDRERKRYPRQSARWYSSFLQNGRVLSQNATHLSPVDTQ